MWKEVKFHLFMDYLLSVANITDKGTCPQVLAHVFGSLTCTRQACSQQDGGSLAQAGWPRVRQPEITWRTSCRVGKGQ